MSPPPPPLPPSPLQQMFYELFDVVDEDIFLLEESPPISSTEDREGTDREQLSRTRYQRGLLWFSQFGTVAGSLINARYRAN